MTSEEIEIKQWTWGLSVTDHGDVTVELYYGDDHMRDDRYVSRPNILERILNLSYEEKVARVIARVQNDCAERNANISEATMICAGFEQLLRDNVVPKSSPDGMYQ